MADMELLLEAERRGILPPDKTEMLAEARRRGLVPGNTRTNPNLPYQQSPAGQAVARRYGVLPEQLEEARGIAQADIEATPRITAKTLVRGLPAAGGAMVGAGAGPLGAILGGGLGYSIGGRLEELFGLEDRPASVPEAIGKAAEDIPTGAAYEMGGQVVGKVLGKILGPRSAKITPQGEKLAGTLEKAGVTPSPVDVAPGPVLRKLESLSEKQIGGGRITDAARREIAAMRGDPNTGVEGWLPKEARRVSGPEHQLDASRVARGETIQAGLKDIATAHRVGEAVEWEFPRAEETGVPDFRIDNLRAFMRSRAAEAGDVRQAITPGTSSRLSSSGGSAKAWRPESTETDLPGAGPRTFSPTDQGPRSRLRGENEPFVTEQATRTGMAPSELTGGLAQGKGPITLRQAMALRKTLGEMYERGDRGPLAALRADMEADAGHNPARAAAWDAARKYTREYTVPFQHDQPLGRLIDRNEPVAVIRELMQPRDARINLLRAIKKQTGGAGPVWHATNSEALAQTLENPTVLKNMGPETKALLFSPEQRAFLDEMQNWVETTSAIKKVGGSEFAKTGQNVVALEGLREGVRAASKFATLVLGGQAAAVGGVPGMLAGGTIAMAPNLVARMLTNPKTAYWLTQGIKTPAGTSDALRVLSQLYPAYMQALGDEARETRQPQSLQGILQGAR